VSNVVHMPGVAEKPHGDVILADVAREDASVVIDDLRELCIPELGSITLDSILVRHRGEHRVPDGFCSVQHLREWAQAGGRYA